MLVSAMSTSVQDSRTTYVSETIAVSQTNCSQTTRNNRSSPPFRGRAAIEQQNAVIGSLDYPHSLDAGEEVSNLPRENFDRTVAEVQRDLCLDMAEQGCCTSECFNEYIPERRLLRIP